MQDIVPIKIDLSANRKGIVNESWLAMFGGAIELLLRSMFSGSTIPVSIRGSQREINSFTKTLKGEKKYIEAVKKYGLDDPKTFKDRSLLQKAISQFEKVTGLIWPIK